METLMRSASSLKLGDNNIKFQSLKNDLFTKSPLHHSCYNNNNKDVDFKLSISVSSICRGVRPVSLSSSHTQAESDNHEFLIEESPNGHTIEAEAKTVRVKFQLQRECSFGQNFLVTGDDPVLGLWDPNNAIPLTWSDGHLWTVDLDIPIEKCVKFKFIMQESDGIFEWQPGPDRVLECFKTDKIITLREDWEDPDLRTTFETEPTENQEIQKSAVNEEMPEEPLVCVNGTEEPKGYETNVAEVLESDDGVPVLVPGLSQYQEGSVNEVPIIEQEPVKGATMVSTGADIAIELILPELDLKEDANTSNLNPRPEISSIHNNQDSCENKHQDIQQVAEEQDHQATQLMKRLHLNDNHWGNNIMQRLLKIFGIQ